MWTKQEKTHYMNYTEKDGPMLSMMLRRTSGSGNRFVESNMLQRQKKDNKLPWSRHLERL